MMPLVRLRVCMRIVFNECISPVYKCTNGEGRSFMVSHTLYPIRQRRSVSIRI